MKSSLKKQAERFLREQKNYKRWLAVFVCLAVVVTIGTTAALKYKGIAVTSDDSATEAMHMDQTEGNTEEIPEGMRKHVHTEACYEEQLVLVCGAAKAEAGETADAGAADTETSDAGTADSGASDTGAAPEESEPADASQGHTHSDDCYEVTGGMEKLTCTIEEHTHGDKCYETKMVTETVTKTVPETVTEEVRNEDGSVSTVEKTVDKTVEETVEKEEKVLTCTKEEHTHDASCYTVEGGERTLVCGKEEGEGAEAPAAVNADAATDAPAASTAAETAAPASTDAVSEETKAPAATPEGTEKTDAAPAENAEAAEETAGEHVHNDSCYELQKVLICGKEEGELEEILVEGFAAGTLVAEGEDYEIIVSYGPEAEIPEGARLEAEEIPEDSDTYKEYYDKMLDAVTESGEEEQEITFARLFDINIFSEDGENIEPKKPVEVQIIYDDAVVGEEDDGFAVHFPDDGDTEVIDAEVTDGKEFRHTQSSFSPTIFGARAKKIKTLTKKGNGFEITAEFEDSFPSGTRELEVKEITSSDGNNGNAYGKYLHNSKKAIKDILDQQEDPEVSGARVFEVSIIEIEEQIGVNNVKVTVRYTQGAENAQKAGSKVMVLDDGEESGTVLSSEAVQEGEEVAVFSGIQNFSAVAPNVMTTMLAGVTLAAEETEPQKSILEDHPEWLEYLTKEPNNTWQIVEEGYVDNGPGNKPTVGDKVDGNVQRDEHVRIQKNVIPTGTENEFYVYLSIDTQTMMEEVLNWDFFKVVTAANAGGQVGAEVSESSACPTSVGINPGNNLANKRKIQFVHHETGEILYGPVYVYWDKAGGNASPAIRGLDGKLHLASEGQLIDDKKNDGKILNVVMTADFIAAWKQQIAHSVSLDRVEDKMGKNIEFVELLAGDYKDGTACDENGKLTWIPDVKTNPLKNVTEERDKDGNLVSTTTDNYNVAELLYRVRLNVDKDGFYSCADNMDSTTEEKESYRVNESAVLKYSFGEIDKNNNYEHHGEATFPVPYVRGLLYDIRAKKVDESGNAIDVTAVQNAEFKLRKTDGHDPLGYVKDAADPTKDAVWKPNADGELDFEDLPWGTYTIVETKSPDRYEAIPAGGKDVGTVIVCWTTNEESLMTDPDKTANKLYKGKAGSEALTIDTNNRILIKNKKLPPIMLEKVWYDEQNKKGLRPSDIQFKVEYQEKAAADQTEENTNQTEDTINWLPVTGIKEVSTGEVIDNDQGIVSLTGEVSADSWSMVVENLPDAAAYKVTEILRDTPSEDVNYQIKLVDGKEVKVEDVPYPNANSEKTIKRYTITNELKSRKVVLYKADAATIDTDKVDYLDGAEFILYDKLSRGNSEEDSAKDKATAESAGKVTTMGPSVDNGQFFDSELKVGDYWLEETKAPENYKADGPYILHIGMDKITLTKPDGTVYEGAQIGNSDDIAVRVPNTLALLSGIKLTKISDQRGETVLEGAKFVLAKIENDSKVYAVVNEATNTVQKWASEQDVQNKVETPKEFTSGEDGLEDLPKLEAGEYELKEVEAPKGYNLLADPIRFTVTKNLELRLLADSTTARIDEDDPLNIIITNSAGIVLPEAGGPGTAAYTFGGLAMIIAVSLMYGLNMRRKREKGGLM